MTGSDRFELRDLRNKQFFQVDDLYLNGHARHCGIYATGVYFALCRHANNETQSCFPSVSLIAAKLGISEIQVKRALKTLEAHNIIKVERTPGKVNVYYLVDKSCWTSISPIPVSNRYDASISQIPGPVSDRYPKDTNIRKRKKDTYPSDFESFYAAYPKHEAKKGAFAAWQKVNIENGIFEEILRAIEKQKVHKEQLKKNREFCPNWPLPATWLNGRRWEDEIPGDGQTSDDPIERAKRNMGL
jgi:DNA-binding transcriptional regulator GbsR (MarR family)